MPAALSALSARAPAHCTGVIWKNLQVRTPTATNWASPSATVSQGGAATSRMRCGTPVASPICVRRMAGLPGPGFQFQTPHVCFSSQPTVMRNSPLRPANERPQMEWKWKRVRCSTLARPRQISSSMIPIVASRLQPRDARHTCTCGITPNCPVAIRLPLGCTHIALMSSVWPR